MDGVKSIMTNVCKEKLKPENLKKKLKQKYKKNLETFFLYEINSQKTFVKVMINSNYMHVQLKLRLKDEVILLLLAKKKIMGMRTAVKV